jgi:hypothetical protein
MENTTIIRYDFTKSLTLFPYFLCVSFYCELYAYVVKNMNHTGA